jgi:GTPase SAR1 family protein
MEGNNYLVQIWDTAGMEKFRSLIPSYLCFSDGVIIVYSVDNKDSFDLVKSACPGVSVILLENKVRLENEANKENLVSDGAWSFCVSKVVEFYKTSALTKYGADDAFDFIVQQSIGRIQETLTPKNL